MATDVNRWQEPYDLSAVDRELYEAIWWYVEAYNGTRYPRDEHGAVVFDDPSATLQARKQLARNAIGHGGWHKGGNERDDDQRAKSAASGLRAVMRRSTRGMWAQERAAVMTAVDEARRGVVSSTAGPPNPIVSAASVSGAAAGPTINLDELQLALSCTEMPRSAQYEILAHVAELIERKEQTS